MKEPNDSNRQFGYGNKGTVSGATWASESSCKKGGCLNFDGIDDYVGTL
jgi:hypothetical protein